MGRPSMFTQAIADEICFRLADGESLRKICKDKHLPSRVCVFYWLLDKKYDDFFNQYAKAREAQAEHMFDELLEICDNPNIEMTNRDRLRVDVRKWYLSKVVPKLYGDKTEKEINVNVNLAEEVKKGRMRVVNALRDEFNDN